MRSLFLTLKAVSTMALLVLTILQPQSGWAANGLAPAADRPMSVGSEAYQRTSEIYFDKCVGCHGVDREGRAGSELFGSLMQLVGDDALKHVLHFGTPGGMPNWGSAEQLSETDVERLAEFLQLPEPESPGFTPEQVQASWQELATPANRSSRKSRKWQVENLFVSLLHDVGRVLLIDGASKDVLFSIPTGVAPTAIELSLDGRYLYVLHRDGRVVSIDLWMPEPRVIASVRVGFEARAIAVGGSRRKPWLLVGAQAPSQLVQLNPKTLQPLKTTVLARDPRSRSGAQGRVEQILNLGRRRLTALMTTGIPGDVYVLHRPDLAGEELLGSSVNAAQELRSGSADVTGRYALFPSNTSKVVVYDSMQRRLLPSVVVADYRGGSAGTSFTDPEFGPVWASSSLFSSTVVVIGTDPKRHPEHAWRPIRTLNTKQSGSMFIASHPKSDHLWVDSAVSRSMSAAGSVTVFDLSKPNEPGKVIALHKLIDLAGFPGRVLHPQFNAAGDELWLTLWNRIDRRSAVVVMDDATLTVKKVIEDSRLITPIRTFSVATLLAGKRRR